MMKRLTAQPPAIPAASATSPAAQTEKRGPQRKAHEDPLSRSPERLQNGGLVCPGTSASGGRADEHEKPGQKGRCSPVRGRGGQTCQHIRHAVYRVPDADGGDVGIGFGEIAQDLRFGLGRGIDR